MTTEIFSSSLTETAPPAQSLLQFFWRRFTRHRMALVGSGIMVLLILVIALAPMTSRYDPLAQNLRQRFQPPSWQHWMGTDELGRDMWARTLYGGRISLTVGLLAMLIAITVGSAVGIISGYYGGWVDSILMRITDVFLALPRLFVLILLTTLLRAAQLPWVQAGSFWPIALVIGSLAWMTVARLVRAATLELRERDFVAAARSLGESDFRIMVQHIFPNVISPIIVSATLGLAGAIISESGLSFLGFGVQLPTPTWGNMLSGAQSQLLTAPWTAIFPGLMIFITVIAINYVGDGLRDALDPRHVMMKK